MKTKIIILIILCIILLLIVIGEFLLYRNYKNKKLIEVNNKIEQLEKEKKELKEKIDNRNKKIIELQKQKVITKIEYIYLADKEKENAYNELYDAHQKALLQIDEDTEIINTQLKIINEDSKIIKELKSMIDTKKGWGINIFALGGIEYEENNIFKPELMIGATIEKTFDIKIIKTGIEFGCYGKIYEDRGAGLILGFKVVW